MKITSSKVFVFLLIIIAALISRFAVLVLRADYSYEIPKERQAQTENNFNIYPYLLRADKSDLINSFPYAIYLDSCNRFDLNSISNDVAALDSFNPAEPSRNREIISIALTQKLQEKIKNSFDHYNADSLIEMVQWAEKFNQYKDFDKPNAKLYRVINKYWINFTANKLGECYDKEPRHKYDFKFRFLTAVCESKNLSPAVGNTNREKIIYDFISKDYSYLLNKFWFGTGIAFKLILLLFLFTVCYGYYCIYKFHFKKKA